jgi:hypothetical protein
LLGRDLARAIVRAQRYAVLVDLKQLPVINLVRNCPSLEPLSVGVLGFANLLLQHKSTCLFACPRKPICSSLWIRIVSCATVPTIALLLAPSLLESRPTPSLQKYVLPLSGLVGTLTRVIALERIPAKKKTPMLARVPPNRKFVVSKIRLAVLPMKNPLNWICRSPVIGLFIR